MDIDLDRLGLKDLTLLLHQAEKNLQTALLNGCSWQESKDLRNDITGIRIAIHRVTHPHDAHEIDQIMQKLKQGPDLPAEGPSPQVV